MHRVEAVRDADHVGRAAARGAALPQRRVERADHGLVHAEHARHRRQARAALDGDPVEGVARAALGRGQAVGVRVGEHERRGDKHRHVGARLARDGAVDVPERGEVAGALLEAPRGARDHGRVAVVARERELPVAEAVVQVFEVAGGGARGLLRVQALVDLALGLEAVCAAGGADKLPHAGGAGVAVRRRVEGALDHREVLQLVWHALLGEHALDHREVGVGALAQALHVARPREQKADVALHLGVDVHRDGRGERGVDLGQRDVLQLVVARGEGEHRLDGLGGVAEERERCAAVDGRAVVERLVLGQHRAVQLAEARVVEHAGALGGHLDVQHQLVEQAVVARHVAVGVGLDEGGLARVVGGDAAGELLGGDRVGRREAGRQVALVRLDGDGAGLERGARGGRLGDRRRGQGQREHGGGRERADHRRGAEGERHGRMGRAAGTTGFANQTPKLARRAERAGRTLLKRSAVRVRDGRPVPERRPGRADSCRGRVESSVPDGTQA